MKLILFGGAGGKVKTELKLIEKTIKRLPVKQLLHIPFARTRASKKEWSGDWFHRYIKIPGIAYLNAKRKSDIAKARSPLIFISGGSAHVNLVKKVKSNPKLLKLIKNASYYIGESAGSMFAGEFFRSGRADGPRRMLKGLGILKNTVIIPHYAERKAQPVLVRAMKTTKAKIGIGIDCNTAMEFDIAKFPKKYKVIGAGGIKLIKQRK